MITGAAGTLPIGRTSQETDSHTSQNNTPSLWEKIGRIWALAVEVGFKEMRASWTHVANFFLSLICRNPYGLNPKQVQLAGTSDKVAKIILLLPGQGGGSYCYFPLAKKLHERKIHNVFTLTLKQTKKDPVPTESIAKKIDALAADALKRGATSVEFALVGHSLGALAGSKYIWRHPHPSGVKVSMLISAAGRLRYISNRFSWFCEDVRPEIESTYRAIQNEPAKVKLFTVSGEKDGLVPSESVHIFQRTENQLVVKGAGHGGVIVFPECTKQITDWVFNWVNSH